MTKILFAHSNPKLLALYAPHLLRHFTLDSATDGLTALRKIKANQPDLIVSDYQLSFLSGIALLKFVRNHPVLGSVPYIFLTDHTDIHSALSNGANDWLPLNTTTPDLLLERVFRQLRRI